MRRLRLLRLWKRSFVPLLVVSLAAVLLPVQAQDDGDGRGVVRLAGTSEGLNAAALDSFAALLYPRLFPTENGDNGIVEALPASLPADEATLTIRDDAAWSDGQPITAYDALFSLLSVSENPSFWVGGTLREIAGIRLVDERTIALRYAASDDETERLPPDTAPLSPTCDDLPRSNIYVVPAHYFAPDFRAFVDERAPEGESPSLSAWQIMYRSFTQLHPPTSSVGELVTGSAYRLDSLDETVLSRFVPADGSGAALEIFSTLPTASSGRPADVNAFIAGELDLLVNPPYNQRAALRELVDPNVRNVRIAEVPGRTALIIQLNFANPQRPLPGFHPESGETLDQGQHPIFSDLNVRRALQYAIDQDAIIDGVFQQSAARLSGLLPPASWAYDPSLPPLETDIDAAEALLEEAGWHDSNGDGIRECIRCQTAEQGKTLQFTLGVQGDSTYYAAANELVRQWRRVGAYVEVFGDEFMLLGQTFDAVLLPIGGRLYEDADPDRHLMLTPAGDRLNANAFETPLNYGSYSNPEVTRLGEAASTVPGCDRSERAEIYHQLERVLQDDLPFLFVAAPNELYAAAPNVIGFAPHPGDPLWNVESWVVSP